MPLRKHPQADTLLWKSSLQAPAKHAGLSKVMQLYVHTSLLRQRRPALPDNLVLTLWGSATWASIMVRISLRGAKFPSTCTSTCLSDLEHPVGSHLLQEHVHNKMQNLMCRTSWYAYSHLQKRASGVLLPKWSVIQVQFAMHSVKNAALECVVVRRSRDKVAR